MVHEYYTKLEQFMKSHLVEYKHMIYETSCHTIDDAVLSSKEPKENFVKNICMIDNRGDLIVAIVLANARASTSRVAKVLDIDRPRLATTDEVFIKTGYPAGGVPSFSYNAIYLVDEKVVEKEFIITGGGSEFALIKIKSNDMLMLNRGEVSRIRK